MKNTSVSLFRQVLDLIPKREFEEIVMKHNGDKRKQTFDSWVSPVTENAPPAVTSKCTTPTRAGADFAQLVQYAEQSSGAAPNGIIRSVLFSDLTESTIDGCPNGGLF